MWKQGWEAVLHSVTVRKQRDEPWNIGSPFLHWMALPTSQVRLFFSAESFWKPPLTDRHNQRCASMVILKFIKLTIKSSHHKTPPQNPKVSAFQTPKRTISISTAIIILCSSYKWNPIAQVLLGLYPLA